MNDYLKERELWWPVSTELLASYRDKSNTEVWLDGSLRWYKNGFLHRLEDKPAIIRADGTLGWYKNGLRHRDGDKPATIWPDGSLEWYQNGKLHRDGDIPARIFAGSELGWLKNHLWHRTTGPAVIYSNTYHEYWINGVNITEEVKSWLKTRKYKYPFTPEQQVEFTLTFG